MGIKVYNSLPPYIKGEFHNPRKFETYLKHFLHAHYFYSLKEYFNIKPAKVKDHVSKHSILHFIIFVTFYVVIPCIHEVWILLVLSHVPIVYNIF
jgi:hypothetical protein